MNDTDINDKRSSSEFKGINLGLGLTCLLGFEINLKMGYNEQE